MSVQQSQSQPLTKEQRIAQWTAEHKALVKRAKLLPTIFKIGPAPKLISMSSTPKEIQTYFAKLNVWKNTLTLAEKGQIISYDVDGVLPFEDREEDL